MVATPGQPEGLSRGAASSGVKHRLRRLLALLALLRLGVALGGVRNRKRRWPGSGGRGRGRARPSDAGPAARPGGGAVVLAELALAPTAEELLARQHAAVLQEAEAARHVVSIGQHVPVVACLQVPLRAPRVQDDLALVPHLLKAAVEGALALRLRGAAPGAAGVLRPSSAAEAAVLVEGVVAAPCAALGVLQIRKCLLVHALEVGRVRIPERFLAPVVPCPAVAEWLPRPVLVDLADAIVLELVEVARGHLTPQLGATTGQAISHGLAGQRVVLCGPRVWADAARQVHCVVEARRHVIAGAHLPQGHGPAPERERGSAAQGSNDKDGRPPEAAPAASQHLRRVGLLRLLLRDVSNLRFRLRFPLLDWQQEAVNPHGGWRVPLS
mmetsp:Transcript_42932/g.119499  ORF Transcript_42932/g.119499 Transcript_42932/m.119499 type:complete len:384 (-) Transcript_42932:73-1224(-)